MVGTLVVTGPQARSGPPRRILGGATAAPPFDAIAAGRPAAIGLAGAGAARQPAADQGPRLHATLSATRSTSAGCCRIGS